MHAFANMNLQHALAHLSPHLGIMEVLLIIHWFLLPLCYSCIQNTVTLKKVTDLTLPCISVDIPMKAISPLMWCGLTAQDQIPPYRDAVAVQDRTYYLCSGLALHDPSVDTLVAGPHYFIAGK